MLKKSFAAGDCCRLLVPSFLVVEMECRPGILMIRTGERGGIAWRSGSFNLDNEPISTSPGALFALCRRPPRLRCRRSFFTTRISSLKRCGRWYTKLFRAIEHRRRTASSDEARLPASSRAFGTWCLIKASALQESAVNAHIVDTASTAVFFF